VDKLLSIQGVFPLMDVENSQDLQVSYFISEGSEHEVHKVENWLREKHDGLFRAVLKNETDNELKIRCYCNRDFVVGLTDQKYFKSHFTTHKKSCQAFLQVAETVSSRKRCAEALEDGFSPSSNREELYFPSNNLSEKFSLSNPSPLATVSSHNIVGEVSFFSCSEREMKASIKLFKCRNLFFVVV